MTKNEWKAWAAGIHKDMFEHCHRGALGGTITAEQYHILRTSADKLNEFILSFQPLYQQLKNAERDMWKTPDIEKDEDIP